MKNSNDKKPSSRRNFLKKGAIVMGGMVVATYLGRNPLRRFAAQKGETMDLPAIITSFQPDFWFEVLADNTILMKSPKIEMGQGIFTGYAMMAAEELDVEMAQIKVEHANTTQNGIIDMLGTGGSNSTLALYKPIREVAATMREMLKVAAAKKWGIKTSEITTQNGQLIAGNNKASYAEIASATKEWNIPKTPTLRPETGFKFIGKDVQRVDLQAKVKGSAEYAIDIDLPDMLYAVMADAPYFEGKIKSVNNSEAVSKMNNIVKVVDFKNEKSPAESWLAVVAKSRYAAEQGAKAVEITWEDHKKWQQEEIEAIVTVGNGNAVKVQNNGNAGNILKSNTSNVFRQEYRMPIAAHAQMETYGAVADVKGDKATIYIGTQNPGFVRDQVAKDLDFKKDNIEIKTPYLGGGFGRRTPKNMATIAAIVSKETGKPIKIIPTREQEFKNDQFRPNSHHVLQASLNANGEIEAISHEQAIPDMVIKSIAGKIGLDFMGADWISAGHGIGINYNIPNKSATIWNVEVPYPVSIWRGVGMIQNTFAVESFINELAHKTGKDPIEMRIQLCKGEAEINHRYVKVLESLREKSNWNTPKMAGIGRGIAMCNDRQSVAATAVELAIENGKIVIKKVTQILDCGKAINPDGIRAQMEGCAMMGISTALYEEVLIKDGKMMVNNFHDYPIAMMSDLPDIQTVILQNAPEPYGVGEPPLAPVAPAIAAAMFDLTGKNFRSLPIRI
jgi:isoquinoline 1-oxidoreductase subunit beta